MPDIIAALHAVKGETDATIIPILEKLTQRGFKSNDDAAGAFLGISVGSCTLTVCTIIIAIVICIIDILRRIK